jgi:copper chaperone CopZ
MKTLHILLLALILLTASACFRNNTRTQTFQLAPFHSQADVDKSAVALQALPGIQSAKANLEEGTLTVIFDGRQVYIKNIESALVRSGFSLPNHPAQ